MATVDAFLATPGATLPSSRPDWMQQRFVLPWLLLSLLLHAPLVWWFSRHMPNVGEVIAEVGPAIAVRLQAPRTPAPAPAVSPPPQTTVPAPKPQAAAPVPAPPVNPSVTAPPSRSRPSLDLSLPEVPVEEATNTTENGATILDVELNRRLAEAPRRTGYEAYQESVPDAQYNGGGSWTERVRFGDNCFRLVRGDPLQPFSRDMWYMVSCRD